MDGSWQIRLLGTLSAKRGETTLTRFATSRVAALLARLALFPQRTHSREELAGLLWPDADLEAGRLNLRVALLSLRRQLEPPDCPAGSVLVADRVTIRLHPETFTCDAPQFEAALRQAARAPDLARKQEALHRALALYTGDLLPGSYDEWVLDERERLQALYEEAEEEYRALPPPVLPAVATADANTDTAPSVIALPAPPLGFPGRFTRFFGRSAEKARLTEMLQDPAIRLITLLGPGGAGKTRLALETAQQVGSGFDGPVCFVPLADITDSALLGSAVASALRLPLSGETSPLSQAADYLVAPPFTSTRSLLVLDNMEHLGEDGAAETRALLERVPGLTCLVTSRQKLNLEGEHEMLLTPLPLPHSALPAVPAELFAFPSVQLFVDRAQAIRPDFTVTPGNAEAVAAICRSLEGLPLALELAAARIQALTPGQMQQQLAARLDFLTSRRRDLPPRHRSLRAALEWSTHLLTPAQMRFFTALTVFRGGWTLEAAAAVGEVAAPLDQLEQLRERSLIAAEETPLGMRFRLLESLREFGEEQLSPAELSALARRHADYFGGLAASMDALWNGPKQRWAQDILDTEQDNLRAALTFCRESPGDTLCDGEWSGGEAGQRLAAHLGNYWTVRGLLKEGLDRLEGALTQPSSPAARAAALAAAGWMAAGMGDGHRAEMLLTESIDLGRMLGDHNALCGALRMRGIAGIWHNNYPCAAVDLEEALAISRAAGNDLIRAITLNALGVLTYQWRGDKIKARSLYEEALGLFLHFEDNQRAAYCLHNLGCIAHEFGDYDRADTLLGRSLALCDALGDLWHRAYCLRALGDVRMEQGDLAGAAALLEEGRALCRRLGDRMSEAGTTQSLATVRRRQAEFIEAAALGRSALLLYQEMDHAIGQAEAWINLAETAAALEDWPGAVSRLAAAACRAIPPPEGNGYRSDRLYQSARAALGPAAFEAAWERGKTLTCDEYGLR